jgi:hypothetical protein
MKQKMKPVTLQGKVTTLDEYGEQVISYSEKGTINMFIGFQTGTSSSNNNILTASSTHIGITPCRDIDAGDTVIDGADTYTVDYPVHDGRYTMLFLKKEA